MVEVSTQFMQKAKKNLQIQAAAIQNLKNQIEKIVKAISKRQARTFSSDTETNPKQQVMTVNVLENE